ncbi:MAG: sugar phosphate isomerase/epimerase [Phycisphaerales bacterium]|nr:sugar phosphate isomerase/epimerase [Phycisphaerales bacterium]
MRIAFSTVACPDWTLERVMSFADDTEFDGVELRSFGWGASDLTCDPALTDGSKVRRLALETGTHVMCLGTSVRFDEAVWPPILGLALPSKDRCVEEGTRMIRLADEIECPCVRVFGFEAPGSERPAKTLDRVVRRLSLMLDSARSRRIRVVIENGGSFARAEDLAQIIRRCASPWLGAAYNVAVGTGHGDDPEAAIDLLGDRLWTVKLKDLRGTRPVELGAGDVPLARAVQHLSRTGADAWLVVEWMRYWVPTLDSAESVLPRAMATIQGWIAEAGAGAQSRPRAALSN